MIHDPMGGARQGRVESFDAEAGLGWVVADDDGRYRFHCTAIVDGSRVIDEGRQVTFEVGSAGPGHWEAVVVTPAA